VADPTITVRRNFPRPDPTLLAPFRDVPVCWLVDAMARKGGLDTAIRPLTTRKRIFGTALTVDASPRDHNTPWAALAFARPGDVVVIRTQQAEPHAICGDVILTMARNAGVVGLVTDGFVRDIAGIEPLNFPVFARGTSPNSPSVAGACSIGLPIVLGGVAVDSGDLVVADEEGVAIVPQAQLAATAEALEAVRDKEAKMEKAVKGGQRIPDWVEAALASSCVRYLD
jgi:4-hydroxy-4-methyl-2-oxoglutarate aldolase